MYLSRIELSSEAVDSIELLRDVATPYGAHRALWRLFSRSPEQKRDFLFRQEAPRSDEGRVRFYALSVEPPTSTSRHWDIQTSRFAPQLKTGDRLGFRLRASPTIKITERGARQGKRHDVVMNRKRQVRMEGAQVDERALIADAGLAWLEQKAKNTFRISRTATEVMGPDGMLEEQERPQLRVHGYQQHHLRVGERDIRFSSLEFEGELEVLEPERFLRMVVRGIGPEKAFGFGLMLLRRA